MSELGVNSQIQKFDRLRQLQQRWRREQNIVGQRDDGADRADIGGVVAIGGGRLLCLRSFARRLLGREAPGVIEIGLRQAGRNRGCSLGEGR